MSCRISNKKDKNPNSKMNNNLVSIFSSTNFQTGSTVIKETKKTRQTFNRLGKNYLPLKMST